MKTQALAVTVANETKMRIKGSKESMDMMLAGFFSGSNVLLYGPPGTAKTLFSSTVGNAFGHLPAGTIDGKEVADGGTLFGEVEEVKPQKKGKSKVAQVVSNAVMYAYGRIQGTAGLEERDMIGERDIPSLMKDYKEKVNWKLPVLNARVLHVDEFNRMPTQRQSALLQMMAENKASMGAHSIDVPRKAMFLTMNPQGEGTFSVDPALYDRCEMSITPEFIAASDMEEVVFGNPLPPMPVFGSIEDLESIWKEVDAMPFADDAQAMASLMVRSTQVCKEGNKAELLNFPSCCANCEMSEGASVCSKSSPVSVRALEAIKRVASGLAYIRGEKKVTTKHVREVFPYVIRHRITLNQVDGQEVKHELNMVKGFVAEMESAAKDAVNLRVKASKGQLERSEIDRIKKNPKNLLAAEVLPFVEETMKKVALEAMGNLRKKSVSELKAAMKLAPAEMENIFDQMIQAHAAVIGEIALDLDEEDAPAELAEAFTNVDGDPLMSEERWDNVITMGSAQSDLVEGVRVQVGQKGGKKMLSLIFATAESGEEWRNHAAQIACFNMLPAYVMIEKALKEAGI